jgi:hypothetical protein
MDVTKTSRPQHKKANKIHLATVSFVKGGSEGGTCAVRSVLLMDVFIFYDFLLIDLVDRLGQQ